MFPTTPGARSLTCLPTPPPIHIPSNTFDVAGRLLSLLYLISNSTAAALALPQSITSSSSIPAPSMDPPSSEKKTLQIAPDGSWGKTINNAPPVLVVVVQQKEETEEDCGTASGSCEQQVAVAVSPRAHQGPRRLEKSVDVGEESGRERLKRHRSEMAGKVWIPDTWGHETLLRDWKDCSAIDRSLFPAGLMTAREALVEECRTASSAQVHIGNSC